MADTLHLVRSGFASLRGPYIQSRDAALLPVGLFGEGTKRVSWMGEPAQTEARRFRLKATGRTTANLLAIVSAVWLGMDLNDNRTPGTTAQLMSAVGLTSLTSIILGQSAGGSLRRAVDLHNGSCAGG